MVIKERPVTNRLAKNDSNRPRLFFPQCTLHGEDTLPASSAVTHDRCNCFWKDWISVTFRIDHTDRKKRYEDSLRDVEMFRQLFRLLFESHLWEAQTGRADALNQYE